MDTYCLLRIQSISWASQSFAIFTIWGVLEEEKKQEVDYFNSPQFMPLLPLALESKNDDKHS
jgi:hypothetical protein